MSNSRVISGTQEGIVPVSSTEGRQAIERRAERYYTQRLAKRREIMHDLETRGMEPLVKTGERLMKPLNDRLASIAFERERAEVRLKNPMGALTFVAGPKGFDRESMEKQIEEFVARQKREIDALDNEKMSLLKTIAVVTTGMRDLAEGKRPSAEFLQHLVESEAAAALEIGDSSKRGMMADEKEFAAVREQLKALTDLRSFAESL